jgi:hypothetical protein
MVGYDFLWQKVTTYSEYIKIKCMQSRQKKVYRVDKKTIQSRQKVYRVDKKIYRVDKKSYTLSLCTLNKLLLFVYSI